MLPPINAVEHIIKNSGKCTLMVFASTLSSTYHVYSKACSAHRKSYLLQIVLHKKHKYHFSYLNVCILFAFSGIYYYIMNILMCKPLPQLRFIRTVCITEIYPALMSEMKLKLCTKNTAQTSVLWWPSLFGCFVKGRVREWTWFLHEKLWIMHWRC